MDINEDCARALLMLVADSFDVGSGKRSKPVRLRRITDDARLSDYTEAQIYTAAFFLKTNKFLTIVAKSPADAELVAPRMYVFTGITAKGLTYLSKISDDTTWRKLKSVLGNVLEKTLPVIISTAIQVGIKL